MEQVGQKDEDLFTELKAKHGQKKAQEIYSQLYEKYRHYAEEEVGSLFFGRDVNAVFLPLIFIIGIIGGLLSVIVLLKHCIESTSTAYYLYILSFADIFYLLLPPLFLVDVVGINLKDNRFAL